MASILTQIEYYFQFKTPLVWINVLFIAIGQFMFVYGLFLLPTAKPLTIIWSYICGALGNTAVTAGAHRLWTHRTYKAKLPMRIILMLCYILAGQYSLVQWARDHRTHHKYTDTDADPHNASRGLFFSHCGWLMMKRHPEVKEKGKVVDVSDLWEDPVVRFQQKYFVVLTLVLHVIFPSAVAYYVIGETLKNAVIITFFWRYMTSVNLIWCVNSLAHYWGYKPYNKNIRATQNAFLALTTMGEGWHNFHHTFPWDYRIGEWGQGFQLAATIIDGFAWFGLAYDLKTASPDLIQKVLDKQDLPMNYEAPEKLDNVVYNFEAT